MAKAYFSRKNLDFLLYDVHQAEKLTALGHFADHSKETFDMTIDATVKIADTLMFPYLKEVDREQPELINGQVKVHPRIKAYIKALGESGIIGADFSYEFGGAQLPLTVTGMMGFVLMAANNGMMYIALMSGAARLIANFGSEELKKTYIENMLSGKWQGTMCLTEPQAGSSLSDVQCTATPRPDGSYTIEGQKIFITCGDHDAAENFIHLLIGRIKGAPAGTKGISLFVVPKTRIDGTDNGVTSMGIYHKLGQHGVPAMHLGFGEDTQGFLVGEANQGLKYMFQMMNEARIGVGLTGVGISSAAYYAALEYASERPQSRRLNQKSAVDSPQTMIINHPDVRRMLFQQKAIVEGGLSLCTETAVHFDVAHASENEEERKKHLLLLELLTPIAKTFPSEYGCISTSSSLQVFGGYGFTEDFSAEQYYRDIRITPIYEGTSGIHGQDILGRKLMMENGQALHLLKNEIEATMKAAESHEGLKPYHDLLGKELMNSQRVIGHLMGLAQAGDVEVFLADATLFLEYMGLIVVSWQWLKQGVVASEHLVNKTGDQDFMLSKIETMKYWFKYELPRTKGLSTRLLDTEQITILRDKELLM